MVQEIRRQFRRPPVPPPAPTWHKWHMDEVFIRIQGVQHYLWRAVDQDDVCSISSFRPGARKRAPKTQRDQLVIMILALTPAAPD